MTDQAYLLLFAYLSDLSLCRLNYGTNNSRIYDTTVITSMTRGEMVAMLDRFDAAVAEASTMNTNGWSDEAMRQHAIGIVRRVLGVTP